MKSKIYFLIIIFAGLFSLCLKAQDFTITHGPYIQAVGENEVTIVWTTSKKAVSWVELAPAGTNSFYAEERPQYYQTANGNRVVGMLHKIRIGNLTRGTEYRYRVFSKEVLSYEGHRVMYGNIASTDVYSQKPLRFKTLDDQKQNISFSMVNDIHGRVDSLKALLKDVKFGETDFVLFNGDMVSSMLDETQFFDGFMNTSVKMFAGEVPVFFSRGNHETRGPFSVAFPDYFPSTTGKLYYAFRQGSVFFVVLDCGEDKPDSDIEYSGLAQFDAYRTEQKNWLEKVIQTDEFKSAPFHVVVVHIPPVGSDWHGPLDLNRKILPVLNQAGIDIMLCGHTHRYQYIEPDGTTLKFPILINAYNSVLNVNVDPKSMTIERKSTKGISLNKKVINR